MFDIKETIMSILNYVGGNIQMNVADLLIGELADLCSNQITQTVGLPEPHLAPEVYIQTIPSYYLTAAGGTVYILPLVTSVPRTFCLMVSTNIDGSIERVVYCYNNDTDANEEQTLARNYANGLYERLLGSLIPYGSSTSGYGTYDQNIECSHILVNYPQPE